MRRTVVGLLILIVSIAFAVTALADDAADYKIKVGDKEVGKAKVRITKQGDKELVKVELRYTFKGDKYVIKQEAKYKGNRVVEFTSEFKKNDKVNSVIGSYKEKDGEYVIFVGAKRREFPASQIKAFSTDPFVGIRPKQTGKITILDLAAGKIGVRTIKRDGNTDRWVYPEGWKRDKFTYNPPSKLPVQIKLKRGPEKDHKDLVLKRVWK
ncbi:MAG TPA: hypothetical protein ENF73_03420 [Proteobacteria bacterium]|nr:hypothetical protein [Pseudomonadota bacterium]